jgi:hypothetical protein
MEKAVFCKIFFLPSPRTCREWGFEVRSWYLLTWNKDEKINSVRVFALRYMRLGFFGRGNAKSIDYGYG